MSMLALIRLEQAVRERKSICFKLPGRLRIPTIGKPNIKTVHEKNRSDYKTIQLEEVKDALGELGIEA